MKPLLLNIMADSKLSKKEEAEDNAPFLSRLLTAGTLAIFLYNSKSLWRIAPKTAKASCTLSFLTTLYHIWKRYYMKQDSFSPPPWTTSALCVALIAGHASKQLAGIASSLSRLLIFLCLPSFALDAFESLKEADTCAIFAMGIGSLYPGNNSSLAATMILLMLTGGEALEEYAIYRAGRDLETLIKNLRLEKMVRRVIIKNTEKYNQQEQFQLEEDHDSTDLSSVGAISPLRTPPVRRSPTNQRYPDTETLATELVEPGDIILLKESEIVPVDGIAISLWSIENNTYQNYINNSNNSPSPLRQKERAETGGGGGDNDDNNNNNTYGKPPPSSLSSSSQKQNNNRIPIVDASNVTGESYRRQRCTEGEKVYSGSIVMPGPPLLLKATKPAGESVLALLKKELQDALGQERSSHMEDVCAAIAVYFTPFALCLSVFTLLQRQAYANRRPRRLAKQLASGRNFAWEAALGVLMGATPCPLSIGVPVSFLSGTSSAAKKYITVKSGSAIEQISKTTVCVFDKTGTLTFGRLNAKNIQYLCTTLKNNRIVISKEGIDDDDDNNNNTESVLKNTWTKSKILSILSTIEESSGSVHPIAKALVQAENYENSSEMSLIQDLFDDTSSNWLCDDAKICPGQGVEGTIIQEILLSDNMKTPTKQGRGRKNRYKYDHSTKYDVVVGKKEFVNHKIAKLKKDLSLSFNNGSTSSTTSMPLEGDDPVLTIYFALSRQYYDKDEDKNKSNNSLNTFILYGSIDLVDSIRPGAKELIDELQNKIGIRTMILSGDSSDGLRSVAEKIGIKEYHTCLPHEKSNMVKKLMEGSNETVMMVGDGVNDAAALAMANVGVCIGLNDLSSASADIVITGGQELQKVAYLINLCRKTVNVARDGVRVGMSISVLQMCLAAAGIVPPFVNAILQEFVDLGAILNGLRVLAY